MLFRSAVAGNNVNGRNAWKVRGDGISYKAWEEKQVSAARPRTTDDT